MKKNLDCGILYTENERLGFIAQSKSLSKCRCNNCIKKSCQTSIFLVKLSKSDVYSSFILISKEVVPLEIQIHHTGSQNGSAMFEVIRGVDMKRNCGSAMRPSAFQIVRFPLVQAKMHSMACRYSFRAWPFLFPPPPRPAS